MKTTCERCNGTGKTIFKHVEGGTCFRCGGSGQAEPRAKRTPAGFPKIDHDEAVRKLRTLYKIARERGTTYEDMVEAATGVATLFTLAPEIKVHFAKLPGWELACAA